MDITKIVALIVVVAFIIGAVVIAYLYLRDKTLNDIRADVYQLILKAEHIYKSGEGQTKMKYVIQKARLLLPTWAQFFITDALLEKVVQIWFEAVKDLLDDGKLNKSQKVEE